MKNNVPLTVDEWRDEARKLGIPEQKIEEMDNEDLKEAVVELWQADTRKRAKRMSFRFKIGQSVRLPDGTIGEIGSIDRTGHVHIKGRKGSFHPLSLKPIEI